MNNMDNHREENVFIFDTGGGYNGTITKISWNVFKY